MKITVKKCIVVYYDGLGLEINFGTEIKLILIA